MGYSSRARQNKRPQKRPSHTPSAFKQTDVSRALKAIRVAGYSAARVLIGKDGRIEIITTTDGNPQTPSVLTGYGKASLTLSVGSAGLEGEPRRVRWYRHARA